MKYTDEVLTAYLDGELDKAIAEELKSQVGHDAALAARLEQLRFDISALQNDYMALSVNAPLNELSTASTQGASRELISGANGLRRKLFVTASCAACLLVGLLIGAGAVGLRDSPQKSWREAVAEYQVLYTSDTLTLNAVTSDEVDATLKELSGKVGIDLNRSRLQLQGAQFRRGQMLQFNDKSLVQLAYLHDGATPLAFCLTRDGGPDQEMQFETREGLPIAHWSNDGVSYMVIGNVSQDKLSAHATSLKARF